MSNVAYNNGFYLTLAEAVTLGVVNGAHREFVFGNNPSVMMSGTPADVWYGGGLYPFPAGTTKMEVLSTSAADSATGGGIQSLYVEGLDTNFIQKTEIVNLNGTTPVTLANLYFRINFMNPFLASNSGISAGTVSIRDFGGGTVRAIMPPGWTQNRSCVYSTYAGQELYIEDIVVSLNRPRVRNAVHYVPSFASVSPYIGDPHFGTHFLLEEIGVDDFSFQAKLSSGLLIGEKRDFLIRVNSVNQDNTDISVTCAGMIITKAVF